MTLRTNFSVNPSFEVDTSNVQSSSMTIATTSFEPMVTSGKNALSCVISGTPTVYTYCGQYCYTPAATGRWMAAGVDVRQSGAASYAKMKIISYIGSTQLTSDESALFYVNSVMKRISAAIQIPATATKVFFAIYFFSNSGGSVAPLVGASYSQDSFSIEEAATQSEALALVSNYFDGDTNALSAWTGTLGLSTSTTYTPTLTVTPNVPSAYMELGVTGSKPNTLLYIIRRDSQGSVLIRETSTGIAIYDGSGNIVGLRDYEARQGLATDYILTDENGKLVATQRVTIPSWGTWLKHPGKPFLNTKCLWNEDSEYTRAPRRVLLQPRGAKYPAAFYDTRSAPTAEIKLATTSDEDARMLTSILADGGVLMIDVSPSFGIPVRYVSIGEVKGSRMGSLTKRGLTVPVRVWSLQIDEVAAPVGLPAGQAFTYYGLANLYGSYIAIAATVPTYGDLAVGYGS